MEPPPRIGIEVLLFACLLMAGCASPPKVEQSQLQTNALGPLPVCPICGAVIPLGAVRCPECGEQFEQLPTHAAATRRPYTRADLMSRGGAITPVPPEEVKHARGQVVLVRSDMSVKRVLATLGLSRFRGHGSKYEGGTTLVFRFELASDHILDMSYERQAGPRSGWELRWLSVDETFWYPAQRKRFEAPYSTIDGRKYGQPISSPVTAKELAFATGRLTELRPDMNVRQVLETLGLERFRGEFSFGAGSISLSGHGELGEGHKLDMIYNFELPRFPWSSWKLSWVGLDWRDDQTGLGHWEGLDRTAK